MLGSCWVTTIGLTRRALWGCSKEHAAPFPFVLADGGGDSISVEVVRTTDSFSELVELIRGHVDRAATARSATGLPGDLAVHPTLATSQRSSRGPKALLRSAPRIHTIHTRSSGVTLLQNETRIVLRTKSFEKPGGPVRRSVDWHFGQRPDFILHLFAVQAGS
jgi:hypothetical protein